jgi:hypothetical protein
VRNPAFKLPPNCSSSLADNNSIWTEEAQTKSEQPVLARTELPHLLLLGSTNRECIEIRREWTAVKVFVVFGQFGRKQIVVFHPLKIKTLTLLIKYEFFEDFKQG